MKPNTIIHRTLTITIFLGVSAFTGIAPFAWAKPIQAGVSRPFSGGCQTRFEVLSPPNSFPVQLHIGSQCNFSHLGLTIGSSSQTVVPAGAPAGQTLPLLISNMTTYRAANGDQLNAMFVGGGLLDLVTGDVTFSGKETFNGGTGRFAGASGNDSLEGSASNAVSTGEFTVRGTLTY
jgi:hypothetical protein